MFLKIVWFPYYPLELTLTAILLKQIFFYSTKCQTILVHKVKGNTVLRHISVNNYTLLFYCDFCNVFNKPKKKKTIKTTACFH